MQVCTSVCGERAMLLMYNCICIFMCCMYIAIPTVTYVSCSYSLSHIGKYWIVQLDHKLVFRQLFRSDSAILSMYTICM